MLDSIASAGGRADERFQEIEQSVNTQIQQLIDTCEAHNDIHWLCEQFQQVLNQFHNTYIPTSVSIIAYYIEPDVGVSDGYIVGPCWFNLTTNPFNENIETSFYDYVWDLYDSHIDNGNFQITESEINYGHYPVAEFLAPDGIQCAEWVKWVLEHSGFAENYTIEELEELTEDVLTDFADFIESCCNKVLRTVSREVSKRYSRM